MTPYIYSGDFICKLHGTQKMQNNIHMDHMDAAGHGSVTYGC